MQDIILIDYICGSYKIDGAILFIDFSKPFDSLEWDFIFGIFEMAFLKGDD